MYAACELQLPRIVTKSHIVARHKMFLVGKRARAVANSRQPNPQKCLWSGNGQPRKIVCGQKTRNKTTTSAKCFVACKLSTKLSTASPNWPLAATGVLTPRGGGRRGARTDRDNIQLGAVLWGFSVSGTQVIYRLGGWKRESLEIRESHFCGFLKGIFEFNTPVKGPTFPWDPQQGCQGNVVPLTQVVLPYTSRGSTSYVGKSEPQTPQFRECTRVFFEHRIFAKGTP